MGLLSKWLIKTRWWLIALAAFLLIYREIMEPPVNPLSYGQVTEYFAFVVFLLIVGILVDELLRANDQQSRSFYILDQKHKLSIDLATQESWSDLIRQLVQYPSTQAPVSEVQLLVQNPFKNQFEKIGDWQKRPGDKPGLSSIDKSCQQCILQRQGFMTCPVRYLSDKESGQPKDYCLPINYGKQILALLRFRLEPSSQLTRVQDEVFNNIGDEMGLAIKAHQERKNVIEMQLAETSLAERRSVSQYLHDNLGQNLAFLCLKLDHLKLDQKLMAYQGEIEQLYNAANQSYGIVRNTIETNHPATVPVLINLLSEHAKKVSKRANLIININHQGKPTLVSPEVQRAIFYIFQEVLSNVEKHAQAKRVEIFLDWCINQLLLKISDDGVGFNPQSVDRNKHLGLEIMFEYIAKINGKIDLSSTENSGTTVTITVPHSHEFVERIAYEQPN